MGLYNVRARRLPGVVVGPELLEGRQDGAPEANGRRRRLRVVSGSPGGGPCPASGGSRTILQGDDIAGVHP